MLSHCVWSQKVTVEIIGEKEDIETISHYLSTHSEWNTATEFQKKWGEIQLQLQRNGYFEYELSLQSNEIASLVYHFRKGKKYTGIKIIYSHDPNKKPTWISIENWPKFVENELSQLEKIGLGLSRMRMQKIERIQDTLVGYWQVDIPEKARTIDAIVYNGYEKFPASHKKPIERKHLGKPFTQKRVNQIQRTLQSYRFIRTIKSPEVLFTQDSTHIYVYAEKQGANHFDGFIGFANEEGNFRLTGYLDLALRNSLNSGEELRLLWRADGNQTHFEGAVTLPYLFKLPVSLKADLQLFKQDSTFLNAKNHVQIGYMFSHESQLFLGVENIQSSSLLNQNPIAANFNARFYGLAWSFQKWRSEHPFFRDWTILSAHISSGQRTQSTQITPQTKLHAHGIHHLQINESNYVYLNGTFFWLKSQNYVVNELIRFGGIQSFRGFSENALQAHLLGSLATEYRYILSPQLYVHTLFDIGYFEDATSPIAKNNLMSFGFGLGLRTTGGLFRLLYATGRSNAQNFGNSNALLHLSYQAQF